MSNRVVNLIWAADIKPAAKKLIALRVADRCDDDGSRFFMSLSSVAADTGLSRSQVQRIVKALAKDGLLVIESREPGKVPRYRMNVEKLSPMSRSTDATGGVAPTLPGGSTDATGGVAPTLPGGSTDATRTIITHPLTTNDPGGPVAPERKTTPVEAAQAMSDEGLKHANHASKALMALVEQGASRALFVAGARSAVARGGSVRDPLAYALSEVKRLLREKDAAATHAASPAGRAPAWRPPLTPEQLAANGQRARQAAAALGLPIKVRASAREAAA